MMMSKGFLLCFLGFLSLGRCAKLTEKGCKNSVKNGQTVFEYDLDIWALYGSQQIDCVCRQVTKCAPGPAYFNDVSSCLIAMKQKFACADMAETATALALGAPSQRPRASKTTAGARRTPDWKSLVNGFTNALGGSDGSDNEWTHLVNNIQDDIKTYQQSDETSTSERVAKLVDSIFNSVTNSRESSADSLIRSQPPPETYQQNPHAARVVPSTLVHNFVEVPHVTSVQASEVDSADDILDSLMHPLSKSISSYYDGVEETEQDQSPESVEETEQDQSPESVEETEQDQ
eukprot:Selendium_serpulae@DN4008_c0_g1_i1.p1